MASLDFPSNPTNNQTYSLNGVTYYYNAAIGAWLTQLSTMNLSTSSNTQVLFNDAGLANGSPGLVFDKITGNLGIGITSPSAKLHVIGTANVSSNLRVGANLSFDNIDSVRIWEPAANTLTFHTASTERMRIINTGQIGIGYATPVARLHIASSNSSPTGVSAGSRFFEDTNNYGLNIGATSTYGYIQGLLGTTSTSGYNDIVLQPNGSSVGIGKSPSYTLDVNGTIADSTGVIRPRVLSTTQATNSGTVKEFTGIPSWVNRITVMFNQVSTGGGSAYLVQIGTGGVATTSGYTSHSAFAQISASATGGTTSTSGFVIHHTLSSYVMSGILTISHMGSNLWVASGVLGNSTYSSPCSGSVTLGGTLNFLRVTSATPDTFNGGSVNISYE